jgi:predicted exporter
LPVVYGALYTFGVVALPPLSIRQLNSNTAFLSSIIVGNGINAGIILLARFHEQQRLGDPLEKALTVAWRETWRPTLGASAAASASYASLLITAFRGFNQFGWIGAFGMLLCWAATYALAPVLIVLFGERRFHASVSKPARASRFASRLVIEHPRWVVGTAGVLLAISLCGLFVRRNDWLETNFSHLRRADSFQVGERYWGPRMDATLKTYLTPAVIMTNSREAAERVAAAVTALARQGGAGGLIGRVRTVDDVLPPHRDQALAEARLLARALTPAMLNSLSPADRARVERMTSPDALRPLTAAEIPPTLVAGLLDKDGNIDRNVLVFPTLGPATWDARKMAEFSRDLREVATSVGDGAPVVGSLTLSADIVAAMRRDGPLATASAMIAVLLVALLAFRSLGLSVAAMASLAVGVTLMLGLAAWSGQRINFSNLIALPITFGVAADYSINVLRRFQSHGDIGEAVGRTGGAVALCSTTTIIGFASLVVAQNRALRSFGELAISGELACLATAVLVLPAFLAWRARPPKLALPNVPNVHDVPHAHDAGSRP